MRIALARLAFVVALLVLLSGMAPVGARSGGDCELWCAEQVAYYAALCYQSGGIRLTFTCEETAETCNFQWTCVYIT